MKKIISLILTALILMFGFNVYGENDFTDLKKYGIMEGDPDGNLRLDEEVTRAEMAKITIACLGIAGECEQKDTQFDDVKQAYWASGFINEAYKNGIINGRSERIFDPEASVTVEEVVKMLVCTLGYKRKADAMGVYPYSYMSLAEQIGIFENLNLTGADKALRKDIATLVSNALNVPLMVQASFGADETWVEMNGENGVPLITLRTKFEE